MTDIFSELKQLGLENVKSDNTNGMQQIDLSKHASVKKKEVLTEKDYIFDKTYTCTVCNKEFKEKTIRVGRSRIIDHQEDLRPIYDTVDANKYDIIMCPYCGYATWSKNFAILTPTMIKVIRGAIGEKFKGRTFSGDIYTYDDAIERYKMALLNCMVKHAKASEKSYLCLKLAWLYRGKAENLPQCTNRYEEQYAECKKNDDEFSKKAYEGFVDSLAKENFPICGMDEYTLSYIMGVLARKSGDYGDAMRMLSRVILSPGAKEALKERARGQKRILDQLTAEVAEE